MSGVLIPQLRIHSQIKAAGFNKNAKSQKHTENPATYCILYMVSDHVNDVINKARLSILTDET